ncbi:spore coat protein [Lederbergia sp. NSJ-179]|uniref:spore coat protein n=1 Tax=Lederbergia sp. NSJ-179 TaxID=2931402 RepID=UPI001FD52E00|nr:spore coat protein [Lederbergia sp. NSJ-179]MCJ7840291.1 spore coat protein [Lederbergia sp. NSJ-179]
MQLASHELFNLKELIASCYNTVTCMGNFIQQAQDPELKSMLEKHYPKHIEDYNMKVKFVQQPNTPDFEQFQPDELMPKLNNFTQAPMMQPANAPRLDAVTHNDREIALAYLLNQKAAAKDYAASAVECANPQLRTFLENAFLNSSHHSYEIWQYMTEKGYYPLTAAQQGDIQAIGGMYQEVQQYPFRPDSSFDQQQPLQ